MRTARTAVVALSITALWLMTAAPIPAAAALCDPIRHRVAWGEREARFEAALWAHLSRQGDLPAAGALTGLVPCLRPKAVPGDPQVAVVVPEVKGFYSSGFLVWRFAGGWWVHRVKAERWPEYREPLRAVRSRVPMGTEHLERLELIVLASSGGSGGFGTLQLHRLGEEMDLLWESPAYDHFSATVLSPEWVLTRDRAPATYDEPHAWQANCCLPADHQVLWQRQGSEFVQRAQRTIPNPYRALSLFVGALRKGDRALAAKYAANPEVVAEGAAVLDRLQFDLSGPAERHGDVAQAEARYWEAIPRHLRGPKPGTTRVRWPAGPYRLITERREGRWLVTGVEPAEKGAQ